MLGDDTSSDMIPANDDPFLQKTEALSIFTAIRKRDSPSNGIGYQGLVCECCINQCSYNELNQYCLQVQPGNRVRGRGQ